MPLKSTEREYLNFTRKERNAIYVLLFVMIILIVLPYFFKTNFTPPAIDQTLQAQLKKVSFINDTGPGNKADYVTKDQMIPANVIKPFQFDPNTLDEAGWHKLGLRDKTIQTILHYRNKGGYFKNPEDIKKIYGLKKEEAAILIPYIKISGSKKTYASGQSLTKQSDQTLPSKSLPPTKIKNLNINSATEEDWKSLPGIGEVLSKRIVKFRNSIGGFKSVEEVKRTYGLSDSVFQKIKPMLILEE